MSDPNGSPKTKRLRYPRFAEIARPDVRFAVQAALTSQRQPIYLVNPETNEYIDGAINAPSIYLTFIPPPPKNQVPQRAFGFVPGPALAPKKTKRETLKIDATLYFSYPNNDFFTGYDEKSGVTVIVIQTWHDAEVEKWKRIAQKVANQLAIVRKTEVIPRVYFYISSYTLPKDPEASHQFIIKPESFEGCSDAISHHFLDSQDDMYFEDE